LPNRRKKTNHRPFKRQGPRGKDNAWHQHSAGTWNLRGGSKRTTGGDCQERDSRKQKKEMPWDGVGGKRPGGERRVSRGVSGLKGEWIRLRGLRSHRGKTKRRSLGKNGGYGKMKEEGGDHS